MKRTGKFANKYRVFHIACFFGLEGRAVCIEVSELQEISENAHETRDSISLTSYAGCLGLSPMISAQFTLQMCVAARNREKFTKSLHFGLRGRSRSSVLVPPESLSAVLLMMSSKYASISNHSHARRATSGKIMIS